MNASQECSPGGSEGRVIAIDLGDKRVGLAISDPLGITAQKLPTLSATDEGSLADRIRALIEERGAVRVVVGLPLNMNGEVGPRAAKVLRWVEHLRSRVSIPVVTRDERLTSRQAQRLMIQQDLSRKQQKDKSDEIAAMLILQNYLDATRPPLPGNFEP
ncbi:MAG: Holliday junction resolvase RuvX [Candidatus Omnitrophica bacterium]|nr:Holliday junction resolvase RuvX [Candidatus Omnitrophota bacterium]